MSGECRHVSTETRKRLERGLVEGERIIAVERAKYEATGKYDPAGYAEAYGFLAAAVRAALENNP